MKAINTAQFAILATGLFFAGASIGSFLCVCFYRIPRGMSVVSPPSACPACGNPIAWHDNLPVLSWLLLKGECRWCSCKIPVQYWMYEVVAGVVGLVGFWASTR